MTKSDLAKRRYLSLQRMARSTGRPTDALMSIYALEGFLARLSASAYALNPVLKGGMLIAAFTDRRLTRDIDLQADFLAALGVPAEEPTRAFLGVLTSPPLRLPAWKAGVRWEQMRRDGAFVQLHIRRCQLPGQAGRSSLQFVAASAAHAGLGGAATE